MIPKTTGDQRPLGIPTVLDRVIQQAVAQVIGPRFEPHFSTHSYGFRPQRSARMALEAMERAYGDGLRFAVDCDLKSFFDTVNHGLLMNRLVRKVHDRRVLRLISRYLNAGVILPGGKREPTSCGVPQGGPPRRLHLPWVHDVPGQAALDRGLGTSVQAARQGHHASEQREKHAATHPDPAPVRDRLAELLRAQPQLFPPA